MANTTPVSAEATATGFCQHCKLPLYDAGPVTKTPTGIAHVACELAAHPHPRERP